MTLSCTSHASHFRNLRIITCKSVIFGCLSIYYTNQMMSVSLSVYVITVETHTVKPMNICFKTYIDTGPGEVKSQFDLSQSYHQGFIIL